MKQADTNIMQMRSKANQEKYFKRCDNLKDKNDPVRMNKTKKKKKPQTVRKMIMTLRVYWKKKADIMGW